MAISDDTASGSMLNDLLAEEIHGIMPYLAALRTAGSYEEYTQAQTACFDAFKRSAVANSDSPVGYLMLHQVMNHLGDQEVLDMLSAYPRLAQYRKVEKRATQAHNVLASAVGKPFRDFEATADGVTRRLSDYVGRGQYVLADFWASWCQPCRREVPGLKELYSQYKDSGLIILGVAVWDKPEDTERAIRELDIPWPCIINAGNVPAELYGIKAIPYFILFAPDGTIAARGLRGDALREAIASALGK